MSHLSASSILLLVYITGTFSGQKKHTPVNFNPNLIKFPRFPNGPSKSRSSQMNPSEAIILTKDIHGAKYNESCDLTLHKTYVIPIYKSLTATEFLERTSAFGKHLESNPEMEKKSCFTFKLDNPAGARFNTCDPKNLTCVCNQEEPYVSALVGRECLVELSKIGDKCHPGRMELYNDKIFHPLYKRLREAMDADDYLNALDDYFRDVYAVAQFHSNPGDDRRTCFIQNPRLHLECKSDGMCDCLEGSKQFKYFRNPEFSGTNSPCVARDLSVCNMTNVYSLNGETIVAVIREATCHSFNPVCSDSVTFEDEWIKFQVCGQIPIYSVPSVLIIFSVAFHLLRFV